MDRGGQSVLRNLRFHLPRGTMTAVLGPAGAGKSTLLRSIVGIQNGVRGALRVLGRPAGSRPLRRQIGYQTQEPSVYPELSVAENLDYFAAVHGWRGRQRRRQLAKVGAMVDLRADDQDLVRALSAGQRARVSLAVALLGDPQLLVLDEPTGGLDPVLRLHMWELYRRLAATGISTVVSSSALEDGDRADHLLLLRGGVLLGAGRREDLLAETEAKRVEDAFVRKVGQAATPAGVT
ncbi:ABC transporter ATP-binding protein [Pseudonocardiaceae bacterium YIM PH 21723]|nr:ABC transporter ATP-binding protein [Pseudonocardiaceae bacterium YIM PH 21723]